MSSEEEDTTEQCFELFGDDKSTSLLLNKKQHQNINNNNNIINNCANNSNNSNNNINLNNKRNRQRVDAGEPRNSYSSIPNFSSRPSATALMSGGLYGAIFSQQNSHANANSFGGLFPNGYGPAKMLNELLGRQVKQAQDANGNTNNNNNNNNNNSVMMNNAAAQANDLAHHMLRNILQGKKDLLALDQELRAVSNGQLSPDGQQKITKNNNNNNLIANNNNLMSNNNNYDTKSDSGTMVNGIIDGNCSNSDKDKENCGTKNNNGDDHTNVDCQKLNKDEISENIDDDCIMNSIGDSEPSLASPGGSVSNVKLKEECMDGDMDKDMCRSPSPSPSASNKSDQMDMKRARVENIVSGMHSSPVLGGNASSTPIVNGCKKRKLYHPQQHDNSAVERYAVAAAGLSMGLNLHNLMLNDDDDEDELGGGNILQKRVEKNVLKSQLRSMQEQLAEMQQKYVQLCNRMEQNSDTNPDDDDVNSDLDGDDMMRDNVSDKPSPSIVQRTPTASPNKELPKTPAAQQMAQKQQELAQKQQQELMQQHQQAQAQAAQNASQAMHQMQQQQQQQQQSQIPPIKTSPQSQQQRDHQLASNKQSQNVPADLSDRLSMMRSSNNNLGPVSGQDLEGLADILKTEINASLSTLVDSIVSRFVHQRRIMGKQSEAAAAAADQLNKDLLMASQILDRKTPRSKQSAERGSGPGLTNQQHPGTAMFQGPSKGPQMNSVAAAALYNSISAMNGQPPNGNNPMNPFYMPEPKQERANEQNEALSLVVTPKKKRHKVTDTRITPRTVSRILAQDALAAAAQQTSIPNEMPSPRSNFHHPPPSMLPVSLPTSVAIPNPSLHESQVFSPYSPFFNPHGPPHGPHGPQSSQLHHMKMSSSPPGLGGMMDQRDSPPLPHPPTMLHPALLAAAHHGGSPDYGHIRAAMDANDRNSDCNSADITYDGMQQSMSFSNAFLSNFNDNGNDQFSLNSMHSATLTPMHLRKAKLMFFWVRYPSSAVLKMYFPDIKFNKNNTAQLVKWFSNFREFYYIQMEKYARQAVSEGVKSVDDIHVSGDSEIYRVLNLHYNRNNHIEVPPNFRFVVEQTLREFFRAIQGGKDTEQSWKKSIYKVISRMDDPVPEYFKSPNFLEQLE
ncbi:unnamed protein product [Diamesa hyperborea]